MDDDMLSGPMFADTPKMPTPYELHLEQRVAELEAALRAIRDHKVVGAGLGRAPTLKRMIEDALKGKGAE